VCHGNVHRVSVDYYKRLSAEDRHTFDRWLLANALCGSIFAVLLIAMAFAGSGSIGQRDAAVDSGTAAASEVSVLHSTGSKPKR
jgi:hypothetical protein